MDHQLDGYSWCNNIVIVTPQIKELYIKIIRICIGPANTFAFIYNKCSNIIAD